MLSLFLLRPFYIHLVGSGLLPFFSLYCLRRPLGPQNDVETLMLLGHTRRVCMCERIKVVCTCMNTYELYQDSAVEFEDFSVTLK